MDRHGSRKWGGLPQSQLTNQIDWFIDGQAAGGTWGAGTLTTNVDGVRFFPIALLVSKCPLLTVKRVKQTSIGKWLRSKKALMIVHTHSQIRSAGAFAIESV